MPSRSGTAGVPYSLVVLMVVAAKSIYSNLLWQTSWFRHYTVRCMLPIHYCAHSGSWGSYSNCLWQAWFRRYTNRCIFY